MPLCTIFAKWPAPTVAGVHEALLARALRTQRVEDRHDLRDDVRVAADHQPVAVLQAPDAARDAGVEEADAGLGQHVGVRLVVLVVRVAAVDDDVAGGQQPGELVDRRASVIAPDGTITQTTRSPAGSASTSASSDGDVGDVRVPVVAGDLDARGADAAAHVRAHLAQTDQTDVHDCASLGAAIARPTVPHVGDAVRRSAGEADGHQQVAVLRVVLAVERLLAGELHRLVRVRERQPDERACSARRGRPAGTAG